MSDIANIIKQSGQKHIALTIEFDDLYSNLEKLVAEGYVFSQVHPLYPYLKIYKYSPNAVCERKWDIYTIAARGLILDTKNKKVVAATFIKFWNYNEIININEIFDKDFTVSEKMDGSLGILFYFDNKWMTATCGSFASDQAIFAQKYLDENIKTNNLVKGDTYLAEIIYPENKIVVPYNETSLYLLAVITADGKELDIKHLNTIAENAGFKRPNIYNFETLDQILETSSKIKYTQEGFVIRFGNGVRIKMKGEEYCRIFKLICRVTPIAIWEMLLNKDDMEKIQIEYQLPEEIREDYLQITLLLEKSFNEIMSKINMTHEKTKHLTNKELGLEFLKLDSEYFRDMTKDVRSFCKMALFLKRKGVFDEQLEAPSSFARRKVFEIFRPTANKLIGYSPSNVLNRFTQ